jgi:hypothetical protein
LSLLCAAICRLRPIDVTIHECTHQGFNLGLLGFRPAAKFRCFFSCLGLRGQRDGKIAFRSRQPLGAFEQSALLYIGVGLGYRQLGRQGLDLAPILAPLPALHLNFCACRRRCGEGGRHGFIQAFGRLPRDLLTRCSIVSRFGKRRDLPLRPCTVLFCFPSRRRYCGFGCCQSRLDSRGFGCLTINGFHRFVCFASQPCFFNCPVLFSRCERGIG